MNLSETNQIAVNPYVTLLLAQLGHYANVGQIKISLVDADSFWVDGYFEETNLEAIHDGILAVRSSSWAIASLVRGHVDSISRGINVPNAQPTPMDWRRVNPIFTFVRLAQRIPVRIHLDEVPDGVRLVAGITATVQINPKGAPTPPHAAPASP